MAGDSSSSFLEPAQKKRRLGSSTIDLHLPAGSKLTQERTKYLHAQPYKHAVLNGMIADELVSRLGRSTARSKIAHVDQLEAVVEESRTYGIRGEEGSLPGWGWEQKETDIYKVRPLSMVPKCAYAPQIQQTPDLSSLDPEHLPQETLDRLPHLTRLKDALYSQEFRNLVREVTGCGPLSGKKTDGSVGLYTRG